MRVALIFLRVLDKQTSKTMSRTVTVKSSSPDSDFQPDSSKNGPTVRKSCQRYLLKSAQVLDVVRWNFHRFAEVNSIFRGSWWLNGQSLVSDDRYNYKQAQKNSNGCHKLILRNSFFIPSRLFASCGTSTSRNIFHEAYVGDSMHLRL